MRVMNGRLRCAIEPWMAMDVLTALEDILSEASMT